MPETTQEAYDRGNEAGRIEQRLSQYDEHFRTINGSVAETAKELAKLVMQVQRLADQAVADAKTRVTTAEAVEKARRDAAEALESERVVRKEQTDSRWSPWARAITVVAAIVGVVGLWLTWRALHG
jgi:1-deoxy-D-xylulose 5-phosphate reductoisomerase